MAVFLLLLWLSLFPHQTVSHSLPLHLEPRIVNGIPSKSSQHPFIAAIRSIERDRSGLPFMSEAWCGGSLLRKEYPAAILTSAHCVFNTTNQLIIELNASDVTQTPIIGTSAWPAISYIIHDKFDRFLLDNDIALVFIDADLTQRSDLFLSTVTIPNLMDTECCTNHEILQTMGYGSPSLNAPYTKRLQYTNLEYIERTDCNERLCLWETRSTNCPWYYANDNNICGLGDFAAPCIGDSGGPLIKIGTNEQVGIISWGTLCISTLPTIFTNTAVYYNWVQQQLLSTTIPTIDPTHYPTNNPTHLPSINPTNKASNKFKDQQSNAPSETPSEDPTFKPSLSPTQYPFALPTVASVSTTRYSWRFPTSLPSIDPSHYVSDTTSLRMDTTGVYSIGNGNKNPMDLTVLNQTTFDEYVIVIILSGISCVAIFVVIILCLQKYRCVVYNEDEKAPYDRVNTIPNPLILLNEDNAGDVVECVAIVDYKEDDIIDDLMVETTSSQSANRSLMSALSLQCE